MGRNYRGDHSMRDKESLINEVVSQIKKDLKEKDETAIHEMLTFMDHNILMNYLPEEVTK
jgi:hypothetical protein